jgi:hypothetical protein
MDKVQNQSIYLERIFFCHCRKECEGSEVNYREMDELLKVQSFHELSVGPLYPLYLLRLHLTTNLGVENTVGKQRQGKEPLHIGPSCILIYRLTMRDILSGNNGLVLEYDQFGSDFLNLETIAFWKNCRAGYSILPTNFAELMKLSPTRAFKRVF